MDTTEKTVTVERAYDDLLRRSLANIRGDLARLIYLASTRDYNTGKYHHDGLAAHFKSEIACQALEMAHRQIFYQIAARSLEELVGELDLYVNSSRQNRDQVLQVWQKLEPYRVALPVSVDLVVAQLFVSNIKLALAILRQRLAGQELTAQAS
jgi:broad-specificity NMP kinase